MNQQGTKRLGRNKRPVKKPADSNYVRVHRWINLHFGSPKICENPNCERKSNWFDWCLKTGKKYERKRENFLRMCRRCHRRYDLTPRKRLLAIKNLTWYGKKKQLTPAQVKDIRQRLKNGEKAQPIANKYDLDYSTVREIKKRIIWRHI